MLDIQKEKDNRGISINKVGIKNLQYPIKVLDRKNGVQHTVALINLFVDLYSNCRGIHMSRFIEVIHAWKSEISFNSLSNLLSMIKTSLEATSSFIEISFPYFIEKTAPVSKSSALVNYLCEINGTSFSDKSVDIVSIINIPICSVCPCSKAISENGAHNQRGEVRISTRFRETIWIEDIIATVETAASSDVYSILKRSDEKFVTENSFNNPKFVEDIVRDIALHLIKDENITWFSVSVENYESIHNHNAYANITQSKLEKG
jgi:GTP cyclohydrolase I